MATRRRFLAVRSSSDPEMEGDGFSRRHWLRIQRRAMACSFEITVDQADAACVPAMQAALNQIEAIEAQLTVFRETSAIVELNRHAAAAAKPCEPSVFALLSRCAELSRETDGAFDITSAPLSRCWGFLRREGRVPSEQEIASARELVGIHHVQFNATQSSVRFLKQGVELNLGAVGKGYALDRMAATLRSNGVGRALLSAGRSSLLAIGQHGRGWSIDLVSPRRPAPLARVWLRDAALGTSGAGTQFAMIDGKRYGHVIDPRSGRPSEGMLSATVICSSRGPRRADFARWGGGAADADALSTAFFVGGPTVAQRYCEQHPGVLALLTPDDDSGTTLVIGECGHADVEEP